MTHIITKTMYRIIPCLLFCTLSLAKNTVKLSAKKSHATNVKATKKKPNNPFPKKLIKEMNETELQEYLIYAKAINDKELVLKTFQALLSNSSDQNNLKNYKLDLADYQFENRDFEKAAFTYEEFFTLYPGAQEAEYSQYKAILCWFTMTLAPYRDQSITHKAIFLIEDFLRKSQHDRFIKESKKMLKKCRQKLFEHEAHVFENYIKQKKFTSAQKRYDYMQEKFQDIEHIDQYLHYMNGMLELTKDPKTRPFIVKFNLDNALKTDKKITPDKKAKAAHFFVS
ncbi:MAG: hypothetical protein CL947_04255 [Epsilonproteobacteria bacterium]|nr:hypothetical protein [Campylobacterota bacterium]